jgi:hypothetical protein
VIVLCRSVARPAVRKVAGHAADVSQTAARADDANFKNLTLKFACDTERRQESKGSM